MQMKKRSPIAAIVLAVIIGLMVIALLNGVVRPTQVVVASAVIAPGTVLTENLVELHTIPMGARPADAFSTIEEVLGKNVVVGRTSGDIIVAAILSDASEAGIPAELPEGHVALAIEVNMASGVAGLLRPGQTVTVIGMIEPDILQKSSTVSYTAPISAFTSPVETLPADVTPVPTATPTTAPPSAPLSRLVISGIRVLLVPQSFRYEEIPADSSEELLFSSARSSMASQEGSVIVLDVPTGTLEISPGYRVDAVSLLAALNQYGTIHLALEPTGGLALDVVDATTLNMGELYEEINKEEAR